MSKDAIHLREAEIINNFSVQSNLMLNI